MLQISARPFGPLLDVSTSGCAATIVMKPRITVPLLLMTSVYVPGPNPGGTTNLISVGLTEYMPQATPRIPTETPFNSTGNGGPYLVSDAFAVAPADGAKETVALSTERSPAASPGASNGPLGVLVALG